MSIYVFYAMGGGCAHGELLTFGLELDCDGDNNL